MAPSRDTVSIQPDTVTLSGYDEIWSVADTHRSPSRDLPAKLDAMTKAAENYVWAAKDIPNLPVGLTRTSLLRLLKYYLQGMKYALLTALNRGESRFIAQSRDKLSTRLDELQSTLERVDDGSATLQSGNGNFDIPNRSVLELLVRACYEGSEANLRPTTLGKSPSFKGLPVG